MTKSTPTALVTSGPTREWLDPVRYLTNASSGKQGYGVAAALAAAGVEVTLVSGPVNIPDPLGVRVIHVETAEEMLAACVAALPVDIAVCVAAVCDWRPAVKSAQKKKKQADVDTLQLDFVKNPDILYTLSNHAQRPKIVVGFAAETENLIVNAKAKLASKNCDLILANDVSSGVFGADSNRISLVSVSGAEQWDAMTKEEVARRLVARLLEAF